MSTIIAAPSGWTPVIYQKPNLVPLDDDKVEFYFGSTTNSIGEIILAHGASILRLLREPSLQAQRPNAGKEEYRFFFVAYGSAPVVLRLKRDGDQCSLVVYAWGYEDAPCGLEEPFKTEISIPLVTWTNFITSVKTSGFWEEDAQQLEMLYMHGNLGIFEGLYDGQYHVVSRYGLLEEACWAQAELLAAFAPIHRRGKGAYIVDEEAAAYFRKLRPRTLNYEGGEPKDKRCPDCQEEMRCCMIRSGFDSRHPKARYGLYWCPREHLYLWTVGTGFIKPPTAEDRDRMKEEFKRWWLESGPESK